MPASTLHATIQGEAPMGATDTAVTIIERDELKRKIERHESYVLLETLSPEHFRHAHLPGARNAPPDRIRELAPVLIPDKNTEVVTYCGGPTCHASAKAAQVLIELGYTNVRHYVGGKQEWTSAGLPVEKGT